MVQSVQFSSKDLDQFPGTSIVMRRRLPLRLKFRILGNRVRSLSLFRRHGVKPET